MSDTAIIIIGFIILFFGVLILTFILHKISDRFNLMPSTDSMIRLILFFAATVYLFMYTIEQNVLLGVCIVLGIYMIFECIKYVRMSKIENQICSEHSIIKIKELNKEGYNGAYDISEHLELKYRNDYNIIIPKIIENLKSRNKLPYDLVVYQGSTSK
ncbi:hypothetical protein ACH5BK_04290 [Arcobacter sp. YIC-80]|uniref:hypothetical protein n=1 Tax=Arcobacter sp. YIC-80 TaxID=3376683 RepID=UPI00384C91E1